MKKILTLVIFALMFISSYTMTDTGKGLTPLIYIMYLFLAILIFFVLKNKTFKVNNTMLFMLGIYLILGTISALVNNDINIMITSLLMLFLYLSLSVALPSIINNVDKTVINTSVIALSSLILIPIALGGITSIPYSGIFYNTNAFGLVSSTIFVILLIVFFNKFENMFLKTKKESRFKFLLLIGYMSLMIYFVVISASRTSLVACLVVGIAGLILFCLRMIQLKQAGLLIKRGMIYSIVFALFGWVLIKYTKIGYYLDVIVIDKFNRTSGSGDVLNNRQYVWNMILSESGMFKGSLELLPFSPHNTFLSILSTNGWLSFIIFSLFILISLFHSLKLFFKDNDMNRYFPILSIISFVVLSMGEVMLYKTSMLISFVAIGIATSNKRVTFTS